MDAEERRRRLACCDSLPQCHHCPLRDENKNRSLKDLALSALKQEEYR